MGLALVTRVVFFFPRAYVHRFLFSSLPTRCWRERKPQCLIVVFPAQDACKKIYIYSQGNRRRDVFSPVGIVHWARLWGRGENPLRTPYCRFCPLIPDFFVLPSESVGGFLAGRGHHFLPLFWHIGGCVVCLMYDLRSLYVFDFVVPKAPAVRLDRNPRVGRLICFLRSRKPEGGLSP